MIKLVDFQKFVSNVFKFSELCFCIDEKLMIRAMVRLSAKFECCKNNQIISNKYIYMFITLPLEEQESLIKFMGDSHGNCSCNNILSFERRVIER